MYASTTLLKVEVPRGLPLLLHSLSKAVIREQPENIYEFLANYLEEGLKSNKNNVMLLQEKNLQGDKNTNDDRDPVPETFSVPEGDALRFVIGSEKSVQEVEETGTESQNLLEKGESNAEANYKLETQAESSPTAEVAATKIQAGFRGYKTRKDIKTAKLKQQDEEIAKVLKPPLTTIKEEEEAATKIQANIRGFLVRKKLKHSNEKSFDEVGNCIGDIIHVPKYEDIVETQVLEDKFENQSIDDASSAINKIEIKDSAESEQLVEVQTEVLLPNLDSEINNERTDKSQVKAEESSISIEPSKLDSFELETEEASKLNKDDPALLAEIDKILQDSLSLVNVEESERKVIDVAIEKKLDANLENEINLDASTKESELSSQDDNSLAGSPCPEVCSSPAEKIQTVEEEESISSHSDVTAENTTLRENLAESTESENTPQPRVQRRSTKRNRSPKQDKYRSGVIMDYQSVDTSASEHMHIPSLEELDAEIEAEVMNQAATKIQAGFRGFQVRRSLNNAATRIQSNFRGYRTRKDMQKQQQAAVRIQATVRGFLTRKKIYKNKIQQMQRRKSSAARKALLRQSSAVNNAATRIQAAYRGYAVRKHKPSDTEN